MRFLWHDKQGEVIVLRHCRVVFGVFCSPFILGTMLNMHLENAIESVGSDKGENFSRDDIVKLLLSFYVDNCVTRVNPVDEFRSFVIDARAVMESARFDLRRWEYTQVTSQKNQTRVLTILRNKEKHTLSLKVAFAEQLETDKATKRSILSVAHRIFDQLGFMAPAALCPRLLLRKT